MEKFFLKECCFICLPPFWCYIMILRQKMPDGLFRALHSHNPTQYSDIVVYAHHFYPHIGAGHYIIKL